MLLARMLCSQPRRHPPAFPPARGRCARPAYRTRVAQGSSPAMWLISGEVWRCVDQGKIGVAKPPSGSLGRARGFKGHRDLHREAGSRQGGLWMGQTQQSESSRSQRRHCGADITAMGLFDVGRSFCPPQPLPRAHPSVAVTRCRLCKNKNGSIFGRTVFGGIFVKRSILANENIYVRKEKENSILGAPPHLPFQLSTKKLSSPRLGSHPNIPTRHGSRREWPRREAARESAESREIPRGRLGL